MTSYFFGQGDTQLLLGKEQLKTVRYSSGTLLWIPKAVMRVLSLVARPERTWLPRGKEAAGTTHATSRVTRSSDNHYHAPFFG